MKKQISGYPLILGYLGLFIVMIGGIILLPLLVLPFYPEEAVYAVDFVIPGLASILVGFLLLLILKGKEKSQLVRHQDAILVVAVWILAIVICSVPFMMTGKYNFTQSVFETTSGFSTTALTVVDPDTCPKIFLMFRSITLFFGGVGLILILTSAISDRYGMRLWNAEGHPDRLMPNLVKSARLILSIYSGYIILGTIMYVIFGMSVFDGLNHSIAALSTGGFSTHTANIGYFNSVPIEIITIILMLLGNTNFFVHLHLVTGKFKNVIQHAEIKLVALLSVICIPLLVWSIYGSYHGDFWMAVRVGAFQFFTAITTTGFQTVPTFQGLPSSFLTILIIAMLIGGGIGSTAGGIKQYRVAIALKGMYYSVREKLSSPRVVRTHYINRVGTRTVVTNAEYMDTLSYVFLYLLVFVIGTLIYTAFGYSLVDSMFEFSSALGTVGISIGIVGYFANPIILWTATVGMFLGRLEIVVVYIALSKLAMDVFKRQIM
ncbi:MAG: TrkH family potassium uptake protein [Firmicutes bacterium]|nr:TrkH family potassium uptake protein [Bacillota bacterium]